MSGILLCPHCGSDSLRSNETCTALYPVQLSANENGVIELDYTGESPLYSDSEYRGDLYCHGCGNGLRESELLAPKVYAHRDGDDIVHIEEDSDKGADVRWQAVCWAAHSSENTGFDCGWCGPWWRADDFADVAERWNEQHPDDWKDPGSLAYAAAEDDGREHLRGYGVASDGPTDTSNEDAGHGTADQNEAPEGAGDAAAG